MKIRKGIVGAAALTLGTCLAAIGVGPSVASAGPGNTIAPRSASTVIRIPQERADVTDLARSAAAVDSAIVMRTHGAHARARVTVERRAVSGYYHEIVWTSGFQAQINACRGAVNVTARYHVAVIAEAWQCGGSRFPRAGTLVLLSGVMSGLYRVGPVVAVLNAYVDKTSDIPRGYPLLYQTCRYGNAHTETFTELIPVG